MTLPQRRRWERHRIALEVEIGGAQGTPMPATTTDVCEGGLGLVVPAPLTVGTTYAFAVPAITAAPMPGTVRWCRPMGDDGTQVVGVELHALDRRQTDDLADAVARWRAAEARGGDA